MECDFYGMNRVQNEQSKGEENVKKEKRRRRRDMDGTAVVAGPV